jgi:polar amino acid transport system substrate-binding protein
MVASIILISFFTASVTTEMTVNSLNGEINGPSDLAGRLVGTVSHSTAEQWLTTNNTKSIPYPDVQAAISALNAGEIKAVVDDAPILKYVLSKSPGSRLQLVGQIFDKQFYGFALQQESALRRPMDLMDLMDG